MNFQYYANDAQKPSPLGFITLERFLNAIRSPKSETKLLLEQIADASKKGDIALKSELKKGLYAFTPCVHVKERRKYSDITRFTGLTVLDFDKIDYAKEFKQFLFDTYSSIIAVWLSPSGKGVKALVSIPIVDTIEEYKSYFYGLASEMQKYKGFDSTTQNAVLLLFIGYDKDILIREKPTVWRIKGIKKNEFSKSEVISVDITPTDKQGEWVVNWITQKVQSINDNAHPTIRDCCVSLGGYVASGYLGYYDALNLVKSLIANNSYMQKGISGYQKTAEQSINIGLQKPIIFV